jgi:predicted AlkP superfamily phosphohydrolase/phosphomutase
MQRTIQIEFNELSPALIDEFIEARELSNLRLLRNKSEVFVTDASYEVSLEPWVQWPTLLTGIEDSEHGIRHLGEADRVRGRGVAHELAAAGFKVGVFGSMNLDYGSATPRRIDEKMQLTSVAPTILRLFGVDAPSCMKQPAAELAGLRG